MSTLSDPFLTRAVDLIRDFCQDSLEEALWDDAKLVQLISTANVLVHGDMLNAADSKSPFRFADVTYPILADTEDYAYPGNFRKFLRFVRLDDNGDIDAEVLPIDPLGGGSGIILFDKLRGFRIVPVPTADWSGTWKLYYEAGAIPALCFGLLKADAPSTTVTVVAPSADQLGSLFLGTNYYAGAYVRMVDEASSGEVRRIISSVASGSDVALTISSAFTDADLGDTYEIMPCLDLPLDHCIAWRTVMMIKSASGDYKHRASAKEEYTSLLQEALISTVDNNSRLGPSISNAHLEPWMTESYV